MRIRLHIGDFKGRELNLVQRIRLTRALEDRLEQLTALPSNTEMRGGCDPATDALAKRLLTEVKRATTPKL